MYNGEVFTISNMSPVTRTILILVGIFLVNSVGLYYQWYHIYPWFDTSLHFLGGFFTAMLFYYYFQGYFKKDYPHKDMLIVIGAAVFIGVIWEFSEYLGSRLLTDPIYRYFSIKTYFIGDLDDTIKDLSLDTIGATLFALTRIKVFMRN